MVDETHGMTGREDASNTNAPQGDSGSPTGAPFGAPVPVPPAPAAPKDAALGNDIAQILKEVKLPERRTTDAPKEQKVARTTDIDALLSGAAPQSAAPTRAEPGSSVDTPAPKKDPVQSLHTLKQDLQEVVHEQKISVVKAAALEQDKAKPPVFATPPATSRVKNIVFTALLLIVLGGAALGGVLFVVQDRSTPLPPERTDSLVFTEQTVSLEISGQSPAQLKGLLAEARGASSASLGSITRIVPVVSVQSETGEITRPASLTEFFTAIGAHAPDELLRALSQEFFFGLHTIDQNAPLIVIPVISYDRAFAGMLAWEPTLNADLAPAFVRVPDLALGGDGLVQKRAFEDVVMRNYDVRALKDDNGAVALYYSFPTRNYLVIAESPYTFAELLSRLQAQNRL